MLAILWFITAIHRKARERTRLIIAKPQIDMLDTRMQRIVRRTPCMTRRYEIYLVSMLRKPISLNRRDTLDTPSRVGTKETISDLHTAHIPLMGYCSPYLFHKDTDIRGISLHTRPTHYYPTEKRQAAKTKHGRGRKQKREVSHAAASQYLSSSLWCHQESNRGHKDFQSFALPTELWHHHKS